MGNPINATLKDLAKPPHATSKDAWDWDWGWVRASTEERDYVRRLKGKDLLDYLEQRTEEAFLENI